MSKVRVADVGKPSHCLAVAVTALPGGAEKQQAEGWVFARGEFGADSKAVALQNGCALGDDLSVEVASPKSDVVSRPAAAESRQIARSSPLHEISHRGTQAMKTPASA